MEATTVFDRLQLTLAVVVIAMSVTAFLWSIVSVVRRKGGPYYHEFNNVMGATGLTLSVISSFASPATRHELRGLTIAGNILFLAWAGVSIYLYRRRRTQARQH